MSNEPLPQLSANDLDELMDRNPLDLQAADIAQIIQYHRRQRARRASGEKAEKPTAQKVDISALIDAIKPKPKADPSFKRRA